MVLLTRLKVWFLGTEYTDQVTLASLVIKSQSIGVASTASGFGDVDGILGCVPIYLNVYSTLLTCMQYRPCRSHCRHAQSGHQPVHPYWLVFDLSGIHGAMLTPHQSQTTYYLRVPSP